MPLIRHLDQQGTDQYETSAHYVFLQIYSLHILARPLLVIVQMHATSISFSVSNHSAQSSTTPSGGNLFDSTP